MKHSYVQTYNSVAPIKVTPLNLIQSRIRPVKFVCLVVHGQTIRSADLVCDNGLSAIHPTSAVKGCSLDGGPSVAPVGPKDTPASEKKMASQSTCTTCWLPLAATRHAHLLPLVGTNKLEQVLWCVLQTMLASTYGMSLSVHLLSFTENFPCTLSPLHTQAQPNAVRHTRQCAVMSTLNIHWSDHSVCPLWAVALELASVLSVLFYP